MDNQTIKRRLFAAVHILVSGEETVDERLRKVYEGELRQLTPKSLPHHVRRDYEQLMIDLSRLFEGRSKIDLKRASLLARRVVALYELVIEQL